MPTGVTRKGEPLGNKEDGCDIHNIEPDGLAFSLGALSQADTSSQHDFNMDINRIELLFKSSLSPLLARTDVASLPSEIGEPDGPKTHTRRAKNTDNIFQPRFLVDNHFKPSR
eukprot:GILK01019248.1.p1 GENE.GILK01019248.1~~GILK01019248.1.p1  ORF type:complete len:113 (-),score=13.91 GILK01019248.1:105-443(-)